jgi:transcriptional regulator GlxA family with amidase domain
MTLRTRAAAAAILGLIAAAAVPAAGPQRSTIGILVFDGFLTSDVTAPAEVLGAAARRPWFSTVDVVLVSATKEKTARSEEGIRVLADKSIYDDLRLDVLIVPSSYKMQPLLRNKDLIDFIRTQSRTASWMVSNCSGAQLLGEAGVLDGKNATTWAGGEKDLAAKYPKCMVQSDRNVVVDDKLITSNGGPVSYQAAFELLTRLRSEKEAKEIWRNLQFGRLRHAFENDGAGAGSSNR